MISYKRYIAVTIILFTAQLSFAQEIFVVKPYLQVGKEPSTTSLDLLWQTSANENEKEWLVEYKLQPKDKWKSAGVPTVTTLAANNIPSRKSFNSAITGLAPGAAFSYRVLKKGKPVFQSNGKSLKSEQQPYRFVVFGDVGAGTPEQKPLAQRAFEVDPDFVAIAGDIVYHDGLITEYDKTFWSVYNIDAVSEAGAPLMRSIPFFAAPGNHDTGSRDLNEHPDALAYYMMWDQPLNGPDVAEGGPIGPRVNGSDESRKQFFASTGDAFPRMGNYSFNYGNAHWLVLDSNPYVDWTNKELRDWVANDLNAAAGSTWRFVLFHHPGFNSSREHYEQQQTRLLSPLFEKGNVDVVFAGHVHNYQRSYPLTFVPDDNGSLLMGRSPDRPSGRVVNGQWVLDKTFDGVNKRSPKGIIYVVTGAGGQHLYNTEQETDPDSWQKFTDKFVSTVHSLTVVEIDGKTMVVKQLAADGKELDKYTISK
jgi:predicted phosphodiesterase